MSKTQTQTIDYGKGSTFKILLKLAPPVMLAQLIQALYNIVDSFFIGRYSEAGLTALSIIYPIQLLMIAFGVGTGVGINTLMAHYMGIGRKHKSDECAGTAAALGISMWIIFAAVCFFIMPAYARMSTTSPEVIKLVTSYGRIVCTFSIGLFCESVWTKVLQAEGNMRTPMIAQIVGAIVNIILDPILIWGVGFVPKLGISGAAIATVIGQSAAAAIVMPKGFRHTPKLWKYPSYLKKIYHLGFPNILMQSAYTFYIFGLNMILKTFSDQAVTALGLYYKWQAFFFIPLGAMQTCIVPIVSYNYAAGNSERCSKTLKNSVFMGMALMAFGTLCFELIPSQMLSVFSHDPKVIAIGTVGFRFIGLGFLPMTTSLIFPVFFQAIGYSLRSSALTILRTLVLFVPLGWLYSRIGLDYFWATFPTTEVITTLVGFIFYRSFKKTYAQRGH